MQPTNGPSRIGYALAALVLIAALGGAVALGYSAYETIANAGVARAEFPGEAPFEIAEAGQYWICHEYISTLDGRAYSGPAGLESLIVRLTAGDGRAVALTEASTSYTYSVAGRQGRGLWRLRLEPGAYVLTGKYPPGTRAEAVVLAVQRDVLGGSLVRIGGAAACGLGGGALALALFIVTVIRRSSARNRAA